ncbi:MAG: holo-ACP synthase [Alphaproteobacteria bacterium]|nr:holo-ACP synthase [Alphaproteobacteria bacterium]
MILGIGTDMAAVARIEDVLQRHGERFLDRCFAPEERAWVEKAAAGDARRRAAGYAKRWAAKEACAKALGHGIRDEIFLKDIAVINDSMGAPSLALSGGAKERLTQITPKGMTPYIHISLSDEAETALAFVVISAGRGAAEDPA